MIKKRSLEGEIKERENKGTHVISNQKNNNKRICKRKK